ncbi:hypothetical protein Hanom_Chr16g01438001 [Helianthus anomalus]
MNLNLYLYIQVSLHVNLFVYLLFILRVKCYFSLYSLGHFESLFQRFYFSFVGSKRFHRYHFSPLSLLHPFFLLTRMAIQSFYMAELPF